MMMIQAPSFAADAKPADPKMQEMMKKMMAAGTPGPEHKVLADLVGDWTFTAKHWETPAGKPIVSTGTSTFKMILGGRWLQQDIKSEMMGMPVEGMGLTGYDNIKKKYQSLWFDNMGTGVMIGEGSFDAKSKTLTDGGKFSCPMTGGDRNYRAEWKLSGKNNFTYSMFGKGLDDTGKEFKQMEITYKRVK